MFGLFRRLWYPVPSNFCVLITYYGHYKYASFLVTFDLKWRSHDKRNKKPNRLLISITTDWINIKLCMDIGKGKGNSWISVILGYSEFKGDNWRALKYIQNLNFGCFTSTMILNFFKLCMIINLYHSYKCVLFRWPVCDLYSRSQDWLKIQLDSSHISKSADTIKMRLCMDIA